MAETVLRESDLSALLGVVAGLEGYLRLGVGDPTGRAHALKQVARRFTADLTRDLGPAEPDDDALAHQAHELGDRLRAQLAALPRGAD